MKLINLLVEMDNKKAYDFEIYIKNPRTGETGWEIKFVRVFAKNKELAKRFLKKIPNFDAIILFDGEDEMTDRDIKVYARGGNYRFLDSEDNRYIKD